MNRTSNNSYPNERHNNYSSKKQSDSTNNTQNHHLANKFSLQKLQDQYVVTLQSIIISFCQYITQSISQSISIKHLEQLYQELKFHQKIKKQENSSITNLVQNLDDALKFILNKYNQPHLQSSIARNTLINFPHIKAINTNSGNNHNYQYHLSSLATIAQKDSQENLLLSNYIRKNHQNSQPHQLKRNNNNSYLVDHHSQALKKSDVYMRQQTRRSLDIERMEQMEKKQKKLYNDLQKLKGKDIIGANNRNPFFHIQQKRDKKGNKKYKLNDYHITKYI